MNRIWPPIRQNECYHNYKMKHPHRFPSICLILLLLLSCWSGVHPHDYQVWLTEISTAFILILPLAAEAAADALVIFSCHKPATAFLK